MEFLISHPGPNAVWTAGWLVYGAHVTLAQSQTAVVSRLASFLVPLWYSVIATFNPSLFSQWLFRNNKGSPPVNPLASWQAYVGIVLAYTVYFFAHLSELWTGITVTSRFYDYLMLMYIFQDLLWERVLKARRAAHLQRQGKM